MSFGEKKLLNMAACLASEFTIKISYFKEVTHKNIKTNMVNKSNELIEIIQLLLFHINHF